VREEKERGWGRNVSGVFFPLDTLLASRRRRRQDVERPSMPRFLSRFLSLLFSLHSLFLRFLTLQRLADDALALVFAALLALERLAVQVLSAEAGIAAQHFCKGEMGDLFSFSLFLSVACALLAGSARAGYYARGHLLTLAGKETMAIRRDETRSAAETRVEKYFFSFSPFFSVEKFHSQKNGAASTRRAIAAV